MVDKVYTVSNAQAFDDTDNAATHNHNSITDNHICCDYNTGGPRASLVSSLKNLEGIKFDLIFLDYFYIPQVILAPVEYFFSLLSIKSLLLSPFLWSFIVLLILSGL